MKLGVYSTMTGLPWGGSEQLWSEAALSLQQKGHQVAVNYHWWPDPPGELLKLQAHGGHVYLRRYAASRLGRLAQRAMASRGIPLDAHHRWLDRHAPDLVLVSLSYHLDPLGIAAACRRRGVPYALLLHCASRYDWITGAQLDAYREAYAGAQRCYFVSRENQEIVEANLACRLPNARVVDNPIRVENATPLAWPAGDVWRFACVGRLHVRSKGQDLILEVLRAPRWRRRPVQVVFYGEDQDSERQLRSLVELYGLQDQVVFAGYQSDREAIWAESHALLLPSRYEGMPMVTLEAMWCGRIAVVTDCGRNGEWVDDGETGFLVGAPAAALLADAMERAWTQRHEWEGMGVRAAERIRARYGDAPVAAFAAELESLAAGR